MSEVKQIKSFSQKSDRNDEYYGFITRVYAELPNLSKTDEDEPENPDIINVDEVGGMPAPRATAEVLNPALTKPIDRFESCYREFDRVMKLALVDSKAVTTADENRDKAWLYSNAYVKAIVNHPYPETAEMAREIARYYDRYGYAIKLGIDQETGVLDNLIQDLRGLSADLLKQTSFSPWLEALEATQNAFKEAQKARTEAKAQLELGAVKIARGEMEAAYTALANTVNALALIEGDASYATFIDHVNVIIDEHKTVVKSRQTKAANKKQEEASKPTDPEPTQPEA
ncbi:MAG: DUF6261 family protein [Parabacteroides sp.]